MPEGSDEHLRQRARSARVQPRRRRRGVRRGPRAERRADPRRRRSRDRRGAHVRRHDRDARDQAVGPAAGRHGGRRRDRRRRDPGGPGGGARRGARDRGRGLRGQAGSSRGDHGASDGVLVDAADGYDDVADARPRELTGGRGTDVFFELVGTTQTMTAGIRSLAKGGRFVSTGYTDQSIDIHPIEFILPETSLDLDRRRDAAGPAGRARAVRGRRDDRPDRRPVPAWRASTTRSARCANARCSAARSWSSPDRPFEGGTQDGIDASRATADRLPGRDRCASTSTARSSRRRGALVDGEPGDRADARARRRSRPSARSTPRSTAAARAFDVWRFTPPTQRARLMWQPRRPARGEQGRVRDDRGARQRQADVGGAGRRHRAHDRAAALLRGVDDEDRGQGPAELDPGDVHGRQARAGRRRRGDHAVELPAARGRRTSSARRSRPAARS